jgi:hypothetical protein
MIPFPITAIIVLTPLIVIGALIVAERNRMVTQPRGLLGKAYAPTFALLGVIVIGLSVWIFS